MTRGAMWLAVVRLGRAATVRAATVRAATASIGAALVALAAGGACGKDPLVDGGCRAGLSECSLRCVDLARDPQHCGSCGNACAAEQSCAAGVCTRGGDGGGGGDGGDGDASIDGSTADGADGAGDDGGGSDATEGDGASCTPPFDNPDHCGDCFTRCVAPTPVCGLQGTYKCLAQCEPPLEACGPLCVDKFSDSNNCGACGNVCPSGICQAGMCVGKGFGHEIVIGMDYADETLAQSSAPITMLANAAFLPTGSVSVLSYEEFADAGNVARIKSALTAAATARGRSIAFTSAGAFTTIPAKLAVANYQVFFIYDQARAPVDQMATAGTLWNRAMQAYTRGGGVIIALEGGSGGRMRDLFGNGGLLEVTDEKDVVGTLLQLDAPTDVVGLNLPNIFVAKRSTVAFTTPLVPDNHHVFVVKDEKDVLPVVVHSVRVP